VIAGAYDLVIASGVEWMPHVPIGSQSLDRGFLGTVVRDRYDGGLVPQGISAELIADRWHLTRQQLDAFSAESHLRAAKAWADGLMDSQVTYVNRLRTDETIRPESTVETLADLRLAFKNGH
jgi:acetyl-CoA acyltransferase